MEVTVSARHTEVSAALREMATDKISRLSRFLEGMDRAEVHFIEERNPRIADREICEVTMEGHGHHVRCKVAAPDGFSAVDAAVAKLEHQLHKLKNKVVVRDHGGRRPSRSLGPTEAELAQLLAKEGADTATDGSDASDEPVGPRIVKSKRHALRPMTPEEAVLQLDLVAHDFWFFTNAETGRAAVLYRRDDGDLGLIDEAD